MRLILNLMILTYQVQNHLMKDGFKQSWADMVNCQETGIYPQSFTSIDVPVLMLHGEDDPHPGRMIREVLVKHIPQLEYHEFPKCGHNPEIERYARADFFQIYLQLVKCRF